MHRDSIYGTVVAASELSGGSKGKVQRRKMCHSVSYHSYTAKFSTCPINLICLARAGMYSVAFMHYWLPDLQYITCPGHAGKV